MTQEEIIRMALDIDGHLNDHARGIDLSWETLVKIVQKGIDHEREACAEVCEEVDIDWRGLESRIDCAAAIRARGNK